MRRSFPSRSGLPISYANFTTAPARMGVDAAAPHGWRSVSRDFCGHVAEDVPRDLALVGVPIPGAG